MFFPLYHQTVKLAVGNPHLLAVSRPSSGASVLGGWGGVRAQLDGE